MDTKNYVTNGRLDADLDRLMKGATLKAAKPTPPKPDFLAKLSADTRQAFEALASRLESGTFPDLYDFNVDWGCDTAAFRNVDPEAFALANDGSGNYWLLCADGAVRSWCHDEGGRMEDHNSFSSLDDAIACFVRYTAVREEHATLDDVRADFEAKREENDGENGWTFLLEQLEEL